MWYVRSLLRHQKVQNPKNEKIKEIYQRPSVMNKIKHSVKPAAPGVKEKLLYA